MRFNSKFSTLEVASQYFEDFYHALIPKVENHITSQLINKQPMQEKVYAVLNELSWSEWQKSRLQFVNPITKILITLIYDKVLLTLKKLENSTELNEFLIKISILATSQVKSSKNKVELRDTFFQLIEGVWKVANQYEPRTPILDLESFPLNKLLEFVFYEWGSCLATINLIHQIERDSGCENQLLLPYIFEIGIPVHRKQQQGQIFTPVGVVDFICKQNISTKTTRVLDPACGTGLFLLETLGILTDSSSTAQLIELIGVEKDPYLADIAESAINFFLLTNSISLNNWKIHRDDFFNCSPESFGISQDNVGQTVLLMNPPYTRHEKLKDEYKKYLADQIEFDIEDINKSHVASGSALSGRSGLYVFFLIHATRFLKPGDQFGLIIPNSWLDVDYGHQLQQFILNHYFIESIIVSRLERLIQTVDVNTVVLKLVRKRMKNQKEIEIPNKVAFISIEKSSDLNCINIQDTSTSIDPSSEVRIVSVEQNSLSTISKWGVYLRAPLIYFQLMEHFEKRMVALGEIAHVRRGFTSGANNFFYVGKPGKSNTFFNSSWNSDTGDLKLSVKNDTLVSSFNEQGFQVNDPMFIIEKEYWMHRSNSSRKNHSWEFSFQNDKGETWVPNYLVKSPRELSTFEIQETNLKYVVILISQDLSMNGLQTGIKKYIKWGEQWVPSVGKKFNQRPTCLSRKNWFELPSKEYKSFDLLCLMTINDRFPFFYNPCDFYFDARLYGIQFFRNQQIDLIFSSYFLLLNSIITTIQLELIGRSNLGEGALDVKVYEYELLKIPSHKFLVEAQSIGVDQTFSQFLGRSPFSIIQEKPKLVKKITDDFVSNLFSLSPALLDSLFNELKKLVQMRIEKARK